MRNCVFLTTDNILFKYRTLTLAVGHCVYADIPKSELVNLVLNNNNSNIFDMEKYKKIRRLNGVCFCTVLYNIYLLLVNSIRRG